MAAKKKKKAVAPTAEAFVLAWDASSSAQEVADKFGMEAVRASNMAWYMRSKGVDLKKMPRGRKPVLGGGINPAALNAALTAARAIAT